MEVVERDVVDLHDHDVLRRSVRPANREAHVDGGLLLGLEDSSRVRSEGERRRDESHPEEHAKSQAMQSRPSHSSAQIVAQNTNFENILLLISAEAVYACKGR